jgi:hypothetical protein
VQEGEGEGGGARGEGGGARTRGGGGGGRGEDVGRILKRPECGS